MRKNYIEKILIGCICCYFFSANAQTVTTFAGSTLGSANGTGTDAQFYRPTGVAVASDGTVFVADRTNNLIRKITPDGVVTTLAGSTTFGFVNGLGTAAKFRQPSGIAVDANGNVYVADQYNRAIRKITSDGVVTTLAGSGVDGFADGVGSEAQFSIPVGIVVSTDGIVFVSDTNNHRIRRITADGMVTTFAGSGIAGSSDGTGTEAQFSSPAGLTIATDGSIYVADSSNHRIRRITTSGVVTTIAGSGTPGYAEGTGTGAQFSYPNGIAVTNDGILFVADYANHRIRKITTDGAVTTLAGNGGLGGYVDGIGTAAQFYLPFGIAIATDGTLFVAEFGNSLIRKIIGTLDTANFQIENYVSIYPNPSSSLINIELENLICTKIILFDINGRILKTENSYYNQTLIDISNLANGIYLMQIITEKGTITKKIIKQ